jgi:hypothetical protein
LSRVATADKRLSTLNFEVPKTSEPPEKCSIRFEAGLDVGKLKKMLAQDQSELRDLFQKQKDNAAHGLLAGAGPSSSSRIGSKAEDYPLLVQRSGSKPEAPPDKLRVGYCWHAKPACPISQGHATSYNSVVAVLGLYPSHRAFRRLGGLQP